MLPLCFRPLKRPPPAAAAAASPAQLLHSPKKPKIEEDEKLKMDADESKQAADEVGRLHGVPVYPYTLAASSSLALQPFPFAKEGGIMIMPSASYTTLQTLVC